MELADEVAKPVPMILEKSREIPGDWKKGNIISIFKKGRKEDPGNSASPLCLGKSWSSLS